jgi:hypothetical protein
MIAGWCWAEKTPSRSHAMTAAPATSPLPPEEKAYPTEVEERKARAMQTKTSRMTPACWPLDLVKAAKPDRISRTWRCY